MKKSLMLLICVLISSPVFAKKTDTQDKPVMNIFEIGVRPDRDRDFEWTDSLSRKSTVSEELSCFPMEQVLNGGIT